MSNNVNSSCVNAVTFFRMVWEALGSSRDRWNRTSRPLPQSMRSSQATAARRVLSAFSALAYPTLAWAQGRAETSKSGALAAA